MKRTMKWAWEREWLGKRGACHPLTLKVDEKTFMFKITMKANCQVVVKGDLPFNSLTKLWHGLVPWGCCNKSFQSSWRLPSWQWLVIQCTFNTLNCLKKKVHNHLSTHHPLVVGMHAQKFHSIDEFLNDVAYDEKKYFAHKVGLIELHVNLQMIVLSF